MKLLTLASILATVSMAFAQTNTTPNAAPAAQNTPNAAAVDTAKKAVKKNKKAAVKTTKKSELKGSATVTTTETAQTPQVETTKTTTTTITETTAPAGTSVAANSAANNNAKTWSAAASVYGTTFADDTKDVSVQTTVGGDIQVIPNVKAFGYQTFETLTTSKYNSETENDNFKAAFYDVGLMASTGSIFGSNDSTLGLRYRNPQGDAFISKVGDWSNIHGFIQAESSIPYTITPAIGVSIDSHIRHSIMKDEAQKNRAGVIPQFKYSFNDTVSVYQRAGYIISLRDNNDMRREFERAFLATGVAITPISGLSIDLNVNQDKAIYASPATGVAVSEFNVYDAPVPTAGTLDEVKYDASVSYSF
jgi:hypothetical protein